MLSKATKQTFSFGAAKPSKSAIGKGAEQRVTTARILAFLGIVMTLTFASIVSAKHLGDWSTPVNAESIPGTSSDLNTVFNDGCPILSPDSLSLYFASNRPGGLGGLDIWVAHRVHKNAPFGTPENLGEPVNTTADEFCPSPTRGHRLYFVSTKAGGFGGSDIYVTRFKHGEWEQPQNLGCNINSTGSEASPSYFEDEEGNATLYFSSNRSGGFAPDTGTPDSDIYFSLNFGPAQLAPGLNTTSDDSRPNVRHDGREIVFDSTRPGTLGGPDIWTATRENTEDDWDVPTHLDAPINSEASETRASLSWDGKTMVFGSTRVGGEGSNDIYVTTRRKRGHDDD